MQMDIEQQYSEQADSSPEFQKQSELQSTPKDEQRDRASQFVSPLREKTMNICADSLAKAEPPKGHCAKEVVRFLLQFNLEGRQYTDFFLAALIKTSWFSCVLGTLQVCSNVG